MIDNFELIKPLLNFEEGYFYFLQIIKRKKDLPNEVKGSNNSSRIIRTYTVHNMKYLDTISEEVRSLCTVFQARAGINLNRRSYKKVAFKTLTKISEQLTHEDYRNVSKAYNSVCGKYAAETDKHWILDFDRPSDEVDVLKISNELYEIQPEGNKIIATLPSKSGLHIISKPFNIKDAKQLIELHDFEIHKNNPTNLFIP